MSLHPVSSPVALPLAERMRASRTSINPLTCLATDFLNQYNEVAMSLDMLLEWPDMFDELRNWQPRSYADHFRRSGFSDAETLIDAYQAAPQMIRRGFDSEVASLSHVTAMGLQALEHAWDTGPTPGTLEAAAALSSDIRAHVAKLADIINIGQAPRHINHPAQIVPDTISGMNQSDVDALFA
jgi:hypothetical protein